MTRRAARSPLRLGAFVALTLAAPTFAGLALLPAAAASCPCTIWASSAMPAVASSDDANAVELGVKFRTDVGGWITGIRFYKGVSNTGTHVGSLWTATGTKLASATFTSETASGWQQVTFASPVGVSANTTYVASYHAPVGRYAYTGAYFTSTGVDSPPLHALASGADGPNGVYRYGASAFPNQSYNSSNYWVDVVFTTDVTVAPTVTSRTPAPGATSVGFSSNVTATFSEDVQPSSISFTLAAGATAVPAAVTYDGTTRTATLDPVAELAASTIYTATITATDLDGTAMASPASWSFTTAAPPPTEGTILVVTSTSNPFSRYYEEILRNEGMNHHAATDISTLTASSLAGFDVVVLGEIPLTSAQVTMVSDWVASGGNLVAMRPDKKLAGLLGLTDAASTLANRYLLVQTAAAPGAGIVSQTMQFHGVADRYTLNGATAVATLYSGPSTATTNPAVTLRSVGSSGGQAAAFTYDLARSVVYTRQGNPAWAGQERDGYPVIRTDDEFYGAAAADPQPDWVDLDKVAIPQADEQQRLLANLIQHVNADRKPLPRFWYLPWGKKAAIVMTGDDHANGGTVGRFDAYKSKSPAGCRVENWECIRGSSYIYTNTPLSDSAAAAYTAEGFEVALHVNTGCSDFTSQTQLGGFFSNQLTDWKAKYKSLPSPSSERNHCLVWSDWASVPKVQLSHGIRLDTNSYYWPPDWVADRPGFFTGSGMPMRFADLDGTVVDVYQASTQMTDESGQTYPGTVNGLLDRAVGPEGYYGAFTANMHTDEAASAGSDAIVAAAKARAVPVVSGRQMLQWLDGRNASTFGGVGWSGTTLSFTVTTEAGANGIQGMLPTASAAGPLSGVTRDGTAVAFTTQTIKGVEYAFFSAAPGAYQASYSSNPPPSVTAQSPVPGATAVAVNTNVTATFSEPVQASTISFTLKDAAGNTVAAATSYDSSSRTATLDPTADLTGATTYTATVSGVQDLEGISMTSPVTWSFAAVDTTPPSVTAQSPVPGATAVGVTTNVTATFSEPVEPSTISFNLKDPAGNSEAAAVTYDSSSRTATLDPSADLAALTTYTATVSGATDSAGNTMTAAAIWSFTTAKALACPCTIWPSSATPEVAAALDARAIEVGVKFRTDVAGYITGIRFYKGVTNTGTHVANLWTATGTKLASARFTDETATGWQQVNFATPVPVAADTRYVASYHAPVGGYAYTTNGLKTAVDNQPLHALASGVDGPNGVYRYGSSAFPTRGHKATNYWVDVVFTTTSP